MELHSEVKFHGSVPTNRLGIALRSFDKPSDFVTELAEYQKQQNNFTSFSHIRIYIYVENNIHKYIGIQTDISEKKDTV